MQVQSPSWIDPLEEEMPTHSRILAWKIPWTEEPDGIQFMGSQRVGHDLVTEHTHTHTHTDVSDLLSFLKDILTGYSVLNQLIFSFSTSKMFYCLVVSIASDEKLVIIDTVPLNVICPPPHIDCLKMFLFLFGFLKFDYNVPHPVWDSFRFSYVDWHISLVFEKFHLLSLNVFPPHSVFFWASIHIYWTDSVPRWSCFL